MDEGNEVIERVFQRIKGLTGKADEEWMGVMSDDAVEGIVKSVREEFKASVSGNSFLCELMTEL
jgi:hypothetical protein